MEVLYHIRPYYGAISSDIAPTKIGLKRVYIPPFSKSLQLPLIAIDRLFPLSSRQDEVIAALAMSDGVVLLVDVVVGLTQCLGPQSSSMFDWDVP